VQDLDNYRSVDDNDKVLLINRLIRNEEGRMVWSSEAISDSKVMTAYLKQRSLIDLLSG